MFNFVSNLASYSVYPLAAVAAAGVAGCITGRINIKDYLPSFLMHDHVSLEGRSYLHHCADAGNYFWLCFFLTCGRTDANGRDKNENDDTPLDAAVRSSHYECIPPLLRAGAKVSPGLISFAAVHHPKALRYLLKDWKGDLEAKGTFGETPLMNCVKNGSSVAVQDLLEAGARVDAVNPEGDTPLHLVCKNKEDSKRCLELLIKAGADPNATNNFGETPLHCAAMSASLDCIKLLVEAGSNMDALDGKDKSPTYRAIQHGFLWNAQYLIENGANMKTKHYRGQTLLHIASANFPVWFVKCLLAKGAFIESREKQGLTPLHYASGKAYTEKMEVFIAHKANIEAKDSSGRTPLLYAARRGMVESLKYLIANGANLQAKDAKERTALHLAAMSGNLLALKLLKTHGLVIDARDASRRTPLHYAAASENPTCAWYLVANNAQIEARDKNGCTPLHLASRRAPSPPGECTIATLLGLGAKIEAEDASGRTPLHHAVRNVNLIAVLTLINKAATVFATNDLKDTPLHTLARTIPKKGEEDKIASIFRAISAAATGFTSASNQGGDLVNKEGFTPLILALVIGNETVRKLFEQRNGRIQWTRNDLITLTNRSRGFQNL